MALDDDLEDPNAIDPALAPYAQPTDPYAAPMLPLPERIEAPDPALVNGALGGVGPPPAPPPPPPPPPQKLALLGAFARGAQAGARAAQQRQEYAKPVLAPPVAPPSDEAQSDLDADRSSASEDLARLQKQEPSDAELEKPEDGQIAAAEQGQAEAGGKLPSPESAGYDVTLPDAITGGQTAEQDPAALNEQLRHSRYLDALGQGGEIRQEGTPEEDAARAEAEQLGATRDLSHDPYGLAEADVKANAARENFAATQMLHESEHQRAWAEANYKAQRDGLLQTQQDLKKLNADYMALANQHTDPERYMHTRTAAQHIVGFLSSIVAGMAGGYLKTGKNVALDAIDEAISRDMEAQRMDLQRQETSLTARGSIISQQYGIHGDMYRAAEAYRLGAYEMIKRNIQTQAQQFDSNGTTYRELAHAWGDIDARMGKAQADAEDKILKQNIEKYKAVYSPIDPLKMLEYQDKRSMAIGGGAGAGAGGGPYGKVYPSFNEVPEKLREFAFALPDGSGVILANNHESAKQAGALSEAYKAANHDLNELERIAIERKNAKSAGAQAFARWKDTQERHYDQLIIDFANTYGTTIHGGRPLPAGTLEEVMHVMPQLKGLLDGGNTADEIGALRDDLDARIGGKLGVLAGADVKLRGHRPGKEPATVNEIKGPLVAPPVKGANGYGPISVGNANATIDQIRQHYADTKTTGMIAGGSSEADSDRLFNTDLDDIEAAQHKAVDAIQGDIGKLVAKQKKSKLTTNEQAQLTNARKALADRQEIIKATIDARDRSVESIQQRQQQQGERALTPENINQATHGRF